MEEYIRRRASQAKQRRFEITKARDALLAHRYPTSRKKPRAFVVNHGKDEVPDKLVPIEVLDHSDKDENLPIHTSDDSSSFDHMHTPQVPSGSTSSKSSSSKDIGHIDLDLTTGANSKSLSNHSNTIWVVNKGMKQWTGEGIVDQILKFEKKVVYLPRMAQCFNQWIALREILERVENRRYHGRLRCAIRISSERLGDEYP